MKRVSQLDDNGCGIACVAMLARVPYTDARRAVFQNDKVVPTCAKELHKALRKFGIASDKKLVRSTKDRQYRKLSQDAVLYVKTPNGGRHWVVWDAKRRKILDPDEYPYVRPRAQQGSANPLQAFAEGLDGASLRIVCLIYHQNHANPLQAYAGGL